MNEAGDGNIDTICTFDEHGVDGDLHNIALNRAVSDIMKKKSMAIEFLSLTTVHFWRKYFACFDTNIVWVDEWQCNRFNVMEAYRSYAIHAANMSFGSMVELFLYRYSYCNSFIRFKQDENSPAQSPESAFSAVEENKSSDDSEDEAPVEDRPR